MKKLFAFFALLVVAGMASAQLYLPVSADFEIRGYQYTIESSAWNTPTIRLTPYQGATNFNPSAYSWTWRFGENEYSTGMVTVAGSATTSHVDFAITGADFGIPCTRWYSSFVARSGTTVVSFARGYLTIYESPEIIATAYVIRTSPSNAPSWVESIVSADGSVVNKGDSVDQDLSVTGYVGSVRDALVSADTNEAAARIAGDALEAGLRGVADTNLQTQINNLSLGITTQSYTKGESDALYLGTGAWATAKGELEAAIETGGTGAYSKVESDALFATTGGLGVLSLSYASTSSKLDTVYGWGSWATNGLATTSWVANAIYGSLTGDVSILEGKKLIFNPEPSGTNGYITSGAGDETLRIIGGGKDETGAVMGIVFYAGQLNLGGGYDAEGGIVIDSNNEKVKIQKSLYILDGSDSVLSLTVTGGLQVGQNSFHATPAGDIFQDSTNTAVLGMFSASTIANTSGVSVLYAGEAPTVSQYTSLLAQVSALTSQVASLIAQIPALSNYVVASDSTITGLVATAQATGVAAFARAVQAQGWAATNDIATSNGYLLAVAAETTARTADVATVSGNLVLASNAYVAAIAAQNTSMTSAVAASSVSWTSTTAALSSTNEWLYSFTTSGLAQGTALLASYNAFTNAYASAITNVNAATLGGVIPGGYMTDAAWQAVNTNVVFGYFGTVAATNSSGFKNRIVYDGDTNMWFYYDSYRKWISDVF